MLSHLSLPLLRKKAAGLVGHLGAVALFATAGLVLLVALGVYLTFIVVMALLAGLAQAWYLARRCGDVARGSAGTR